MASFRDANNRLWALDIRWGDRKRVHSLLGIKLEELVTDGCKPLQALLSDLEQLVNVVFVLVMPQADKAGISDEDFGAALGGDAIEQMEAAFYQALVDFFPNQKARSALLKLRKMHLDIRDSLLENAEPLLASVTPEKIVAKEILRLKGLLHAAQESLASTPTDSPSES